MASATSRRALWLQKISDQVAQLIRQRITDGELAPEQSPGTREALAGEFVTSLSVIDRALEQLADEGLLKFGDDGGFVVTQVLPRDDGFALPARETLKDVEAILEMRLGLETVSAALAAERRDPEQLAGIEAAASAFEEAARAGTGVAQADFRFHHSIAAASGNPYLLDLLDYLGPLLMPRMRMTLPKSRETGEDENLARSISEHSAIVTAIAARDADAARDAMHDHLLRTISLVGQAKASE